MQNTTNSLSQYSQASRSGSAFISPEQQRPIQYASVQAATLPNFSSSRGQGFISPSQGREAQTYPAYLLQQTFPPQSLSYSSERLPIQPGHENAQLFFTRPQVMEPQSSFAIDRSLYSRRVESNNSSQITKLPPELFLLVIQPKIDLVQGSFEVENGNTQRLREIIEKNFIENNKRVLAEFFNDRNKQSQDIAKQITTLSSSLQTQYDSLKNPPRSASQVARSFSSPEHMRPNGPNEADAKANNYLKLRLNAVIESLSQIESEQTYNEIKQCLTRLVGANQEITLDQKHNELLGLNFQESRSSSTLSSPASLQSLPQGRESRGGILRQDPTKRIEDLQTQNEHTLNMFTENQKSLLAEQQKLSEATQQIEHLNQLKLQYEQTIYQLNTKLSSYERNSARLNLLAQQEIDIESAKQEIKELESQKQELQSQLNDASQTNQEQKDQLNQRLQEKQSEIEDQQKKINELGSLIAQSKEGIASMNSDIAGIQESLSQNLTEFESDASKHLEATDRIISEGMVRDEDNSQSIQTLEQELSKIKMAYNELKNSSSKLDKTQSDKDITIQRLQALLAKSQREIIHLNKNLIDAFELIEEKEKKLVKSESLRKELTGESAVENWLLPSLETSVKELTNEDIEKFMQWGMLPDLTNQEILKMPSRAQQSSTLEQRTQTTDLPTQQLSRSIEAMASGQILSALKVVETVNEAIQNPINSTVFQQPASLQQASSSGPAEPHPDILLPASLQPASSPSSAPQQTQNNRSRLMTEMQAGNDLMSST